MDVLFLTTVLPAGRRGGGEVVSQSVIEALRGTGEEVRVLGYCRPGSGPDPQPGEECVGSRPIETSTARFRSILWMARALLTDAPYSSVKYRSRAYKRAVRKAMAEDAQAVVVDHAQMNFALKSSGGPLPPFVFLAHNAEGDMYAQVAAATTGRVSRWAHAREARKIRQAEARLAELAQQVWVLTADDAEYFATLCPTADVRTLDVASMITDCEPAAVPEYDVALIGNWTWRANARGLEWFASDVIPRLPDGVTVAIAGAGAEWLRGRHPNVSVQGVVPCAQEFMARARVAAVPSVTGGGVQVKTLDAIACGVPVVATKTAVRGIRDLPRSVAIADSPGAFADELRRLATLPDRHALREEAAAWNRARKEALEELVSGSVSELPRTPIPEWHKVGVQVQPATTL